MQHYRTALGTRSDRSKAARGVTGFNHKRVYRVMREADLLLTRHTGKPTRTHDGKIITLTSNLRWCSDGFEIRCARKGTVGSNPTLSAASSLGTSFE